jgi:DNA-binding NtrC family response regulator
VERAAALTASEEVGEEAIVVFDEAGRATNVRAALLRPASVAGQGAGHFPTLVELERDYLVMLAREFGGRSVAMSRAMGVSYATMRRKILRHGLDVRAIVDAAKPSLASTD